MLRPNQPRELQCFAYTVLENTARSRKGENEPNKRGRKGKIGEKERWMFETRKPVNMSKRGSLESHTRTSSSKPAVTVLMLK